MDRLGPLNAFIQAAESRSFTAAGRALGISSSAVGKAVARLEARLGVPLFYRSTRSISLTSEGAQFLKRCQTIFGEIEAAELEIADATSSPRGRLRVSLPLIGMLMMPAISAFIRAYPEVRLDLDFSDDLVDIIEEGFDVVLRTGKVSDSRLKIRTLGNFPYVIVGSAAYFKARGVPEKPEDLTGHACLFHRWPSTGKLERWALSRKGAVLDLDIPAAVTVSTMEPLIAMVERDLGLMYTPAFTVRRQLAEGTLQSVLEPFLKQTNTLQMVWPQSRHQSPKVKAFVEFMAKNLPVA